MRDRLTFRRYRLLAPACLVAALGAGASVAVAGRAGYAHGPRGRAGAEEVRGAFVFEANGALSASNADGTGLRCLVPGGGPPVWAPNASMILFSTVHGLATLRVRDGSVHIVARNVAELDTSSWSPDSRRLVYTRVTDARGGGFELVVTDAQGRNRRLLARHSAVRDPSNPAWSPRRAEVAFTDTEVAPPTREDPTRSKWDSLFVIRPDGHARRRIARDIDGLFSPVWSPNGTMITFARRYGPEANLVDRIWVVRADGTNAHPVGPLLYAFDMSAPAWSSDGRFLAVEGEPVNELGETDIDHAGVYLMRPDRLDPKLLALGPRNDTSTNWVAWAPGVAVIATGIGGSIALVDAGGGAQRIIVARGDSAAWDPLRRATTAYHGAAGATCPDTSPAP